MKRRWLLLGGGLLLLLGGILLGIFAWLRATPRETAESQVQAAVAEWAAASQAPAVSQTPDEAASGAVDAPYVSPVDFEALWAMNPDIYAWLYVPGTEVNYPILQRAGDDAFYLSHNSEGKSSKLGAIFTEETYTPKDFSQPVTVVYGHNTHSGEMLGSLQPTYSAQGGLESHRDVIVYLPEGELHYEVFAAVPHDMRHLMYYHDFANPEVFQKFLDKVLSVRSINASVDRSAAAAVGDQVLILATCLRGDAHQRYLVLAKRTVESSAP